MKVTLDTERQIYVFIHENSSLSCKEFGSLFKDAKILAEKLNLPKLLVKAEEFGQLSAYEKYQKLIAAIGENDLGTWFNPKTPRKVRQILESARRHETTLRLFLGDPKTGKDCLQEHDIIGNIGRSTEPLKVPILINEDDCGDSSILDHWIVRIIRVGDKKEVYRHPNYHLGGIIIGRDSHGEYPVAALVDGVTQARFKNEGQAHYWAAFMMGEVLEI